MDNARAHRTSPPSPGITNLPLRATIRSLLLRVYLDEPTPFIRRSYNRQRASPPYEPTAISAHHATSPPITNLPLQVHHSRPTATSAQRRAYPIHMVGFYRNPRENRVHRDGSTEMGPPRWVHRHASNEMGPPRWVHRDESTEMSPPRRLQASVSSRHGPCQYRYPAAVSRSPAIRSR